MDVRVGRKETRGIDRKRVRGGKRSPSKENIMKSALLRLHRPSSHESNFRSVLMYSNTVSNCSTSEWYLVEHAAMGRQGH